MDVATLALILVGVGTCIAAGIKAFQFLHTVRRGSRTPSAAPQQPQIGQQQPTSGDSGAPSIDTALHQLPRPSADFTGREIEKAELLAQIQGGGVAISGLRGMGGIGKTALALVLAHELAPRYPDAQFYLDLKGTSREPLSSSDAMAHVIRSYDREASVPDDESELQGLYQSVLHGQRALLLMDNAAAAQQVQPLVPPEGCTLLVTSRQRFDLPGLFPVDLDTLTPEDSSALLLRIAPRIGDHAEPIAQLCGYLPMALELAGRALVQRVDLTPARYLQQLQDTQQRFKEVDASLSLSYDLLTPELQRSWRTLPVFPGDFNAAAPAFVWQAETGAAQDSLGALLSYSLLDWDPDTHRYRLHDLARDLADRLLSEEERAVAQLRHAAHFRDVLAAANQLYQDGGEQMMRGLALFDLEWGNIQVGQAWAQAHAEEDDLAAALCSNYAGRASVLELRQPPRERVFWLESALAAARKLQDRGAEGRHLGNLGNPYSDLGETHRAIEYYEQALDISRELGHRRTEGNALGSLGNAYADLGEPNRAIEHYDQRLAIARELCDRWGEGTVLVNLGNAYLDLGDPRRAIGFVEQALVIMRELGNRRGEGSVLGNLGRGYAVLGEHRQAILYYEQRLAIAQEIGDRRGEGVDLWNWSLALNHIGDRHQAIQRAESSLQIMEEIEDPNAVQVREGLAQWRGEEGSGFFSKLLSFRQH